MVQMKVLDTHKMVKHLVEKNFTEEQAEAIVSVVQEATAKQKPGLVEIFAFSFAFVVLSVMLLNIIFFKK